MILILGSINMDLVTATKKIPQIGETVMGYSHNQYPGGKGANQAVCAARLNAQVNFLGKVGKDKYGEIMLSKMKESGVEVGNIEEADISTGLASITVDENGQNNIVVVPGANGEVDIDYLNRHITCISECDIIIAQHETPLIVTELAFKIAKEHDKITILNPAPAMKLSHQMIEYTDILIPNEYELEILSGISCQSEDGIIKGAQTLINMGVKTIIVTMGEKGVWLFEQNYNQLFPAIKVKAIDTTAAGDSFIAGFVTSYASRNSMNTAIDFGQLVASYTIQRNGAQVSMPSSEEIEIYRKLQERKTM